jgi:hypothetical protein
MWHSVRRYKLIMMIGTVLLVLIGVGALVLARPGNGEITPSPSPSSPVDPAKAAADALAKCDALASDPGDPQRYAAPVPDDRFAPGPAREACAEAVRLNPGNARANFQLGRSLWNSRQDDPAYDAFVLAVQSDYCAAKKYVADSIVFNRGFPPEKPRTAADALYWYQQAKACGYAGVEPLIETLETEIRRHTFDRALFQHPDNMQALFENSFMEVESPVQLAYYVKGIIHRLDDENTVFMDQRCKPLLNAIGNLVIANGVLIAVISELGNAQGRSGDENLRHLLRGGVEWAMGDTYENYGNRDATVLFDKEIYGCDSYVTQQIIRNIMIRFNIGDSQNPNPFVNQSGE